MIVFQVIMPGYCVAGTVGHKILNGVKRLEMENKQNVCTLGTLDDAFRRKKSCMDLRKTIEFTKKELSYDSGQT